VNTRRKAIGLVLASIASVQLGSVFAKSLFDAAGPLTMAWLRQITAGLVLLVVVRPRRTGRSRIDWLSLLGYTTAMVGMNIAFYQGMARIPVGMTVTIEFLGPLVVAVITGRGARNLIWALLAAAGVALLGWSPGALNWAGVGFSLLAAAGWAGYILIGPVVGRCWQGAEPVALANLAGAIVLLVPVLTDRGGVWSQPWLWLAGLAVGLLSSVIPYSLELQALRHLEKNIFSILMALEPAAATLAALLILSERLRTVDLLAMACVVAASIGVTSGGRSRRARQTTIAPVNPEGSP
jgi:inner membrane transporter RhtA